MRIPEKIQHYGLEFITVFLGVSLSLIAENWRQQRSDLTAEHNSLVQLYSDLRSEEGDMMRNLETARTGLQSARFISAGVRGRDADSVSSALTGLGQCSYFIPYTSEYTALKSSGRLSIIEDPPLREQIVRFYEVDPFIQWLHERDCTLTGELMDSLLGKLEFAEPLNAMPDSLRFRSFRADAGAADSTRSAFPRDSIRSAGFRGPLSRYPRIVFRAGNEPVLSDPAMRDRIVRLATQRNYLIGQIQRRMESAQQLRARIKTRLGSDTLAVRGDRPRRGGNPVRNGTAR